LAICEKFKEFKLVSFYPYDITNKSQLIEIFTENKIDLVIHFAGLKSVKESFLKKEEYYRVNVFGTFQLLETMVKYGCRNIIFSSTACVYFDEYTEDKIIDLNKIHNPYGKSKYICEELIRNYSDKIKGVILRYFNPVGTIKGFYRKPKQVENLMDVILESIETQQNFYVFGDDYQTKDGSCVRDFIHVEDLAESHIRAMDWILNEQISQFEIFNIGTGKGISVFQLINTFEKVNGIKLDYEIKDRRNGDNPSYFANCDKTKQILNWETKKTLEDMCKSYYL
jgi:UDP-glucose 4-epimerase